MIQIKSERELEFMRRAGRAAATALAEGGRAVRPGTTTRDINNAVAHALHALGAKPSFLGYGGFPAVACVSVNEEVIHGIPGSRRIKAGDIVKLDVGAIVDGYQGDCAATFAAGEISEEARRLIAVTRESFYEGIRHALPGGKLSDISAAIQEYCESRGFSVVRKYVGHGIGREMHEDPEVPNFGRPGHGPRLEKGMTIAVEPMINIGGYEVNVLRDGWTVVTRDGKLSSHYENTIAITDDGPEILTVADGE